MSGTGSARWSDKIMSVLREKQLDACQDRLANGPETGIFGVLMQDEADALYEMSFYAHETRLHHPDQKELQDLVMAHLPHEACYLSFHEDELVRRMLACGGEILLTDRDEISAAEGLIARLWCTLRFTEDEQALLCLENRLQSPLIDAFQTERCQRIRERLFSFDATLHGLLYLCGFLWGLPSVSQCASLLKKEGEENAGLYLLRYLKTSFDYIQDGKGNLLLLHPGLAEPERLLRTLPKSDMPEMRITGGMLLGGMNGILPEEAGACEMMEGALRGSVRPEYGDEEDAVEDLRMMAKQGASLHEMREVLDSMLWVMATPRMQEALRQLHLQTVRWPGMTSAVLN